MSFFTSNIHIHTSLSLSGRLPTLSQNQNQISGVKRSSFNSSIWVSCWIYFDLNANLKSFEIYALLKSIKQKNEPNVCYFAACLRCGKLFSSLGNESSFILPEQTRVNTSTSKESIFIWQRTALSICCYLYSRCHAIMSYPMISSNSNSVLPGCFKVFSFFFSRFKLDSGNWRQHCFIMRVDDLGTLPSWKENYSVLCLIYTRKYLYDAILFIV